MTNTSDFPLAVVANACDGAAALRARLFAAGLDTEGIARLVKTSPLAIARASKGGATPRGVLVGLAVLVTTVDRLAGRGVSLIDLERGGPDVELQVAAVAAESDLAARMIDQLRSGSPLIGAQVQLPLDARERAAA